MRLVFKKANMLHTFCFSTQGMNPFLGKAIGMFEGTCFAGWGGASGCETEGDRGCNSGPRLEAGVFYWQTSAPEFQGKGPGR